MKTPSKNILLAAGGAFATTVILTLYINNIPIATFLIPVVSLFVGNLILALTLLQGRSRWITIAILTLLFAVTPLIVYGGMMLILSFLVAWLGGYAVDKFAWIFFVAAIGIIGGVNINLVIFIKDWEKLLPALVTTIFTSIALAIGLFIISFFFMPLAEVIKLPPLVLYPSLLVAVQGWIYYSLKKD